VVPVVVPFDGLVALTHLEQVVLEGIFEGHSNKEIAVDLQVSESFREEYYPTVV
jgi:FixJ family two-component response regulator